MSSHDLVAEHHHVVNYLYIGKYTPEFKFKLLFYLASLSCRISEKIKGLLFVSANNMFLHSLSPFFFFFSICLTLSFNLISSTLNQPQIDITEADWLLPYRHFFVLHSLFKFKMSKAEFPLYSQHKHACLCFLLPG